MSRILWHGSVDIIYLTEQLSAFKSTLYLSNVVVGYSCNLKIIVKPDDFKAENNNDATNYNHIRLQRQELLKTKIYNLTFNYP